MLVEGKNVLVSGGTGSLGQAVVRRLLTGELGMPSRIVVISRDEAKQHDMRLSYLRRREATDEVIYRNSTQLLRFIVGDMRDYPAVVRAVKDAHLVIHAAALKQVPTCEYFPFEAIQTNLIGAQNLARAIRETRTSVETVVGISTDKACKPINVMGMTKAIMERILIEANIGCETRFACVRYGNVIASRGSVVPLFREQIANGGPVTLTMKEMTRFLLTLDQAVDTVLAAVRSARAGETYVPRVPAARVEELADVMIEGLSRASSRERPIEKVFTGIRPGEKVHEIMVSDEECYRTIDRDGYYVIRPMLPELASDPQPPALSGEYSSSVVTADAAALGQLLKPYLGATKGSAELYA
jgi:FlaA1/EpsC-like NDP-sugar epimerase